MINDAEHFSCAYWPFEYLFGKMFIEIFCPFLSWIVFLLLSCKYSLYTVFCILYPYQTYNLQIFSPILVGCLFTFLIMSFAKNLKNLMKFPLTGQL